MSDPLWTPTNIRSASSNLIKFYQFIENKHDASFQNDYGSLWNWSVKENSKFWPSLLEYLNIEYSGNILPTVTNETDIYDQKYFPNIEINYAQNILNKLNDVPIVFRNETGFRIEIGKDEIYEKVNKLCAGNLILADKVNAQSKVVNHRVKFLAPPQAGIYVFNVDLKSTDYLGLDVREQVKMTVIPAAQLPEYKAHPDDLNLDDEPTLFEQVMSANSDTDSDTDDTSRDGDVTNCDAEVGDSLDDAVLTVAERRRRRARIQRKKQSKDQPCAA